ncbi:glycogen debranching protein [Planctomycetales bacterium ZRK34]|nr:glycogen debranching protein [Planctomycetales bacterium ZRK34]
MAKKTDTVVEAIYPVDPPTGPEWAAAPPPVAIDTEWLLTNGLGSFAMGTVAGVNTRRYHSLLDAATRPPVGRINTLTSLNEMVRYDTECFELAAHEFTDGAFHPKGWQHIEHFEKGLGCRWVYVTGAVRITKTLRLLWRRNLGVVSYRVEPAGGASRYGVNPEKVTLSLRPLIGMRDYHHLRRAMWGDPGFTAKHNDANLTIASPDGTTLYLHADAGAFVEGNDWWYNFKRRAESRRQQDDVEDLFSPGWFEHTFNDITRQVSTLNLYFGTEPINVDDFKGEDARVPHLRKMITHVKKQIGDAVKPNTLAGLVTAADDFVVEREVDGEPMMTILAGYPWFADWGRDTMISLPGLLLSTGRYDEAKRTLTAYARHIRNGRVPNRFDDYGGEPHYNTVDASLWFIHAALEYVELTGDKKAWNHTLAKACSAILGAYERGTDDEIAMDADGLISAGNDHTQLTWMDAKRDGVVFTPRHGKAVEINALWYRALVGCAERLGDPLLDKLAKKVKRSFNKTFWSDDLGFCIDHVNAHGEDHSLRPNQVIAVSLPVSPLSAKRQKAIMDLVREKLLTPRGLRTLAIDDWNYHGHYDGSMFDRDSAYHRGTVWAWPIGPYVEGYLRANKFSKDAIQHTRSAIKPLLDALAVDSLGQLHEVFDGNAPHRSEGCIAQAWSVAEVLRAVVLIESKKN